MPDELKQNQIDYENITRTKPLPEPMTDVDTSGVFTDAIIEAASSQELDTAILNSFSTITRSREEVLNLLDLMGEDPIISTALSIYAADACEPSEEGKIIWCSSNDAKITHAVNHILDNLNIDTNAYSWMYSLCKYGDVYLRLYRESDFDKFKELFKTQSDKEQLNEGILVTKYSKNDRYANYVEMIKNPGEMYDLSKFGKTFGYIKTNVIPQDELATRGQYDTNQSFYNNRTFNKNDIEIFNATDFIHICLDDNSSRTAEEVTLITNDDSEGLTFSVKRGQSILYNAFRVWRELSLLENSVLLNRVTNSSIIRTVSVEVGDMAPEAVRDLLMKIKQMFEQKSSLSKGRSFAEYTNPGPIENTIYIPTHDGKGNITTAEVGSQSGMNDQLTDLDYWKNKLFGALSIPKQYLGCFRGDTKILLLNGKKLPISELYENKDDYIGKGIMACNEDGSLEPTTITNIMLTKPSTDFLRIWLDNGEYVDVTPDHRMMLRDGTFIFAEDLDIGDSLMPYYDKVVEGRRYVLDNKQGKYKPQYRVVAESIYDLPKGCGLQVHHHDHIKINDDFDNLIPLTIAEHFNEHKAELSKSASDFDYDEYDRLRWSREYGRPDTYFKGDTLKEVVINYIDNYVPECNHKVVKIEYLDVAEPAYDITVAADCHTLALPCGIFVHNSTEDSTGFNGGSSLSLISSRYAKTIRRLQNAFIQAIEDAVNLILFDNGDTEYIGKFHLEMQKPTTQEEKDRRANQAEAVSLVENIMRLIKDEVEDKKTRVGILKILLSSSISNVEVINLLDEELERLENGEAEGGEEGTDEFGDFGANGSQPLDLDFGNDELPPMEEPTEPAEPEVPQESFYSGEGSELLVEDEDLPNWEELGVHFNEIN